MYGVLLLFFLQMTIVILLSLLMHIYIYGIIIFQILVERQFLLKIKFVQTDWGGEYRKLSTFFQTIGIHHRLIFPHTHEQNGTVERRHRHIVETGLTLLGQCKAPF